MLGLSLLEDSALLQGHLEHKLGIHMVCNAYSLHELQRAWASLEEIRPQVFGLPAPSCHLGVIGIPFYRRLYYLSVDKYPTKITIYLY